MYTVLRYCWWLAVDMSKTCRVLYQINLRNSASRWPSVYEYIMMHGLLNVKFTVLCTSNVILVQLWLFLLQKTRVHRLWSKVVLPSKCSTRDSESSDTNFNKTEQNLSFFFFFRYATRKNLTAKSVFFSDTVGLLRMYDVGGRWMSGVILSGKTEVLWQFLCVV